MSKGWIRIALAVVSGAVLMCEASAQSASFWYNNLGDASGNMPGVINVTSGQNATLSVYMTTSGIASFTGVQTLFGYSTTSSAGGSASPADTNASFVSLTWAFADLTNNDLSPGTGGGGPSTQTGPRPWGYFAQNGLTSGTYAESPQGTNLHLYDITLHINASAGTDIPINIWSVANPDNDFYVSSVQWNNGSSNTFPASPYTGVLHVTAVPEPASIALLGLGFVAILRRRRKLS